MRLKKKKRMKVPVAVLAARKGNREAEREVLGDGFHARTRVQKSKKVYCRKTKHVNELEE